MRFPSDDSILYVHKFINFSSIILSAVKTVSDELGEFASIHLRNGPDWRKACMMINSHKLSNLFTSYQCQIPVKCQVSISLNFKIKELKLEHCFQNQNDLIEYLKKYVKLKNIFISTDHHDHRSALSVYFNTFRLSDFNLSMDEYLIPFVELGIHSNSDLFIANCPSSFSAFAVKQRKIKNLKTYFWGVTPMPVSAHSNDEL